MREHRLPCSIAKQFLILSDSDEVDSEESDEPTDDPSTPESEDPAESQDDFSVIPGNSPDTVHVPYEPPPSHPEPVIREPDGTERPWPPEPDRPDPEHAPENEPPQIEEPEETPEPP